MTFVPKNDSPEQRRAEHQRLTARKAELETQIQKNQDNPEAVSALRTEYREVVSLLNTIYQLNIEESEVK